VLVTFGGLSFLTRCQEGLELEKSRRAAAEEACIQESRTAANTRAQAQAAVSEIKAVTQATSRAAEAQSLTEAALRAEVEQRLSEVKSVRHAYPLYSSLANVTVAYLHRLWRRHRMSGTRWQLRLDMLLLPRSV